MLLHVGISLPHHPPKDKVTQNCSYYKEIAKIFSVLLSNYLDGWFFCFFVVCFFFTSPLPFLKSAEPTFFYEILFYYTFRVFEILSRLLAMGQGKGIFEPHLCCNIFKTISSNFAEVMLVFSVHNCCLT